MIPHPIRSVLAATDMLTAPDDFLRSAADLAAVCGADLHVLHAFQDSDTVGPSTGDWLEKQKQLHEKRIALRDLLDRLLPRGRAAASARVSVNAPAEAILANARHCNADLIVLGPHRQRPIGDRYLGSTAERVLQEGSVPCLILNGPMVWPIRRILVPADSSAPSRAALRSGMSWVRTLSARRPVEIDFVHVHSGSPAGGEGFEPISRQRLDLEGEVLAIRVEAGVKVPVNVRILQGDEPIDQLMRYAEAEAVDLVVMGTRGDSVFVRAMLGSLTSEMLRRSRLPLLLVPPRVSVDRVEEDATPQMVVDPLGI
jgi:universal stress protein E